MSIAQPDAGSDVSARPGAAPVLSGASLIAAALAWLAALAWVRPLAVPDEGRYTDIARWMAESGDWLVPRLDGMPFLHKPPLYYWFEAAAISLLGHNTFVYRLASLASALLILVCVHALTRRFSGEAAARWAVLSLAFNPLFYIAAQFANLDLPVAALMSAVITLAVLAFAGEGGKVDRRLLVAAYAVSGLATLTKGLIGCVIPGLVFVAYALVRRRPDWLWAAISPLGLGVLVAIVAPWFILMDRAITTIPGGFTRYFVVFHHFQRYVESSFNEHHGIWFYPAVLLGGSLPWSAVAIGEAIRLRTWLKGGRARFAPLQEGQKLGLVWLIAVVVFFSAPASKLTGYILVALPAIGLLGGPFFAAYRWRVVAAGVGAAMCLVAVFGAPRFQKQTPIALAADLKALAQPGDAIVFYGTYWPDCAVLIDSRQPITVVGDWSKPSLSLPDNQHRQLTEGREFEPKSGSVLIGPQDLQRVLTAARRTFVLADRAAADSNPQLKALERLKESPRFVLLATQAR